MIIIIIMIKASSAQTKIKTLMQKSEKWGLFFFTSEKKERANAEQEKENKNEREKEMSRKSKRVTVHREGKESKWKSFALMMENALAREGFLYPK